MSTFYRILRWKIAIAVHDDEYIHGLPYNKTNSLEIRDLKNSLGVQWLEDTCLLSVIDVELINMK